MRNADIKANNITKYNVNILNYKIYEDYGNYYWIR